MSAPDHKTKQTDQPLLVDAHYPYLLLLQNGKLTATPYYQIDGEGDYNNMKNAPIVTKELVLSATSKLLIRNQASVFLADVHERPMFVVFRNTPAETLLFTDADRKRIISAKAKLLDNVAAQQIVISLHEQI